MIIVRYFAVDQWELVPSRATVGAGGQNEGMRIARVYDPVDPDDGVRVLVDRLWPRGIRREDPRTGTWLPEVAPSNELRRWYGHTPDRFAEFAQRYHGELESGEASESLHQLRRLQREGAVTLVTATRETELSHAVVLAEILNEPVRLHRGAEPANPRNVPTPAEES